MVKKRVHKANGDRAVGGRRKLGAFPTVCGSPARSAAKVTNDPDQVTCVICRRAALR